MFDADKQRQLPTRYYLACEADFESHRQRLASAPRRGVKPFAILDTEPSLKNRASRVSNPKKAVSQIATLTL